MYDLETVLEVVGQRLVHAVYCMQEEAQERDVDVLCNTLGREAALCFNCLSMFLQSRTRCDVTQFADAFISPWAGECRHLRAGLP